MPFVRPPVTNVDFVIESSVVYMQLFGVDSDNRAIFSMQFLYPPSIPPLQINVEVKFIPGVLCQKFDGDMIR